MLIKINQNIFNTTHIISAHFGAATGGQEATLRLVFVNHREVKNATGTVTLHGGDALRVWNALCNEATDVTSDEKFWKTA